MKQIVNLHHGSISVTSELGMGTTFLVTLPKRYAAQKLYDAYVNERKA